ncbi:hypothetical protein MtrunA17_Chr5g0434461 [Medicago truncatula]|uniref:Uncharacterized protein n=1 Tax=Medicago truncatula TaxID=3880 RepID=G7KG33_MEDTR|nr:uncharacterized protein LOC11428716 [Medicago truncatula]AES99220.1 hypothetical protein MTR_5g077940 [Medicago truncatula]RHN56900.1 hypothetical protein MtrunA17_Chr5g0434461 [Medicago truncatula]
MASKLSFLNSLTQRKKQNNAIKDDHINEDIAIVKAAAWAWHQRGSGSCNEGEANSSNFYVTRSNIHREPRPSRYKLEAMRSMEKEEIHKKEKSLLDAYEVQSISRHLNRLIESNKLVNSTDNIASTSVDDGVKRTKKKKIRKGFFHKHGVVCGRLGDVVDPTSVSRDGRRQLAKSVPSAKGYK